MLKNCERCGIEFYTKRCRFTRSRFCSWQCRKKQIEKNCLSCKRMFIVSESRGYRKYCSHKCSHDYNAPLLSVSRRGSGNPAWKGGLISLTDIIRNSRKYNIWKKRVRRRDKHICHQCGSKGDTHSHHMIPIKHILRDNDIKTLEEAYFCPPLWNVDNGQTLCSKCHMETDSYGVKRSQISS